MILETRRRQFESEPLIPPNTRFLLTTNLALLPSTSSEGLADIELNTQAYGRYFDRPEVQQACREQALIQTPEFTQLSDDALVGGRFRPRNSDEELVDTSDAAYEKRHRKYETFEKRQRLREKEKLKHEQYKLRERIEQLRAMEAAAFFALPASNFSEPSGTAHESTFDEDLGELPGTHVNGAAAYNEGERRRREMLDVAEALEERYRVLLPPDRKWLEKKERMKRERASASGSISVEPERRRATPHEVDSEEEDELESSVSAPLLRHTRESNGGSELDFETGDHKRSKKLKLRIPPRLPLSELSITPAKKPHHNSSTMLIASQNGQSAIRAADGRFLSKAKRYRSPPRKRLRMSNVIADPASSPAKHSVTSTESGSGRNRQPCVLMLSAIRDSATQKNRKTQRHVTAFGVRVPPEIEAIRDFEIPPWVEEDYEEDELAGDESYAEYTASDDDAASGHSHGNEFEEIEWDEDTKEDIPEIELLDD
ncbi:uncharacterized protein PHACADRAFT_248322 [Phanerochaete carnosa HHB-10118-sp]|uniref:PEHE domain-containing protein n=1 Tax=Phanerochaete carnosa (strain HHB-10118-sp) TaxID=650164 RepID=K5WQ64_PHACS|nr:uncharacterized protein PHACADRAFT_248322 [Phanerochaete carnosa HHB-10118-sp]EKM61620.1 hypothetical protein PHACADRAFT_248322 [Phanerochaete carnosa HHB-10118-sp]